MITSLLQNANALQTIKCFKTHSILFSKVRCQVKMGYTGIQVAQTIQCLHKSTLTLNAVQSSCLFERWMDGAMYRVIFGEQPPSLSKTIEDGLWLGLPG